MLILSLDTTTRSGSVAIVADGAVLYEREGDGTLGHAQRLPLDVMRACETAGVDVANIDLFAVAAGPGAFTGLRIGIAAVQGLAMAYGRHVVAVSTLEALAAAAGGPRVAAWLDAQRGEVFAQVYVRDGDGEAYRPALDAVSAPPALALELQAAELAGAVFHGDGALKYRQAVEVARGAEVLLIDPVRALAGAIGVLAARRPDRAAAPHAIAPIYVRRPDAELARERRARRP